MSDIFISYASEDVDFARDLALHFEQMGWSVWWDRNIPPGKDYARVIEDAVAAASCILVLWSEHSVQSRWVRTEAAEGADRHILVPVLIADVTIPFEFRRIQAADLSDWRPGAHSEPFEQLLGAVHDKLGPDPVGATKSEARTGFDWNSADSLGIRKVLARGATGRLVVSGFRVFGYRAMGALCGLLAVGSFVEGMNYGDEELLVGAIVFGGAAWFMWRKSTAA